ncbi:MAG: DUF1385 domain-containing protein [Anaerolineae bacterium]
MADSKILYGGQAILEGVMMRGRRHVGCAVRRADGAITLHSEPLPPAVYSGWWSKVPFLRAMTLLWDTIVLGTRMLMFSANLQVADELKKESKQGDKETGETTTAGGDPERPLPPAAIYGTLAVSLGLGVGIFFVLPLLLVRPLESLVNPIVSNLLEGVIRFALFLGYLLVISRLAEIRRIFQYHGAEHKTIAAYEAGSDLTPDLIQHYSKEHPRCGTGFLLTVVVVSIFVFALLGPLDFWVRLASRVLLIPVVAAISYELIRFSAAHRSLFILDWLVSRPSLWLQSLTTREPEPQMIEVAVAALKRVQGEEQKA